MSNGSKEDFQEFCNQHYVPVFAQPWWLDAVAESENWNVVIYKKGGEIFGVWPYFEKKKLGLSFLTMPALTKFLGIYLSYPSNQSSQSRLSFEKEVITALTSDLPSNYINQNFFYDFTNWLPLMWQGFSQTTSYSYEINALDSEEIFKSFKSSTRRNIRNAKKKLTVHTTDDIGIIYNLLEKAYSKKNKKTPYSLTLLSRLNAECAKHEQRKILYTTDEKNNIHSAVYLVWDDQRYYYLIASSDPEYVGSNANSLLIWEAIKDAVGKELIFDFEGSTIPSIERYFSTFGPVQKSYFKISKISGKGLKAYFSAKSLFT